MDILSIIIISLLALSAVIGAIIGLVKGFTNVRSWAVELLLAGLIIILISNYALASLEGVTPAIIAIASTVAIVCALLFLFMLFRKLLKNRIEYRKKLSYYKQYDEMEDNTEKILSAMGSEDKKAFKKLSKRKFKQSAGVWGAIDRIFGALTFAITGAVITGFISSFILTVLDFSRLCVDGGSLYGACGPLFESEAWASFKTYIFDFFIIGAISLCIRSGFSNGLFSALWTVAVFGLVVGAGFLSFRLAFTSPEFLSAAEGMEEGVAGALSGMSGIIEGMGITYVQIAQAVLGLAVFLLMLVIVILIGVFVPRLIDGARDSAIFRTVDGVLGAIVMTVLVTAVLLVVGALANSLHDLEFMNVFNAYFEKSGLATYFYDKNLLNEMGILTEFPLIGSLITK